MTNAQIARALRMAALVAASLGLTYSASAQQPSQEQIAAMRAACRADYVANCAGIVPGGARALACLRQHLADLSAPCQQAVNAAIAGTAPASTIPPACPSDYAANCAGIVPGGQRALACLRQHLADLSAPCQQAVNAAIAGTPPAPAAQSPAPPPPAPAATAPPSAAAAPSAPTPATPPSAAPAPTAPAAAVAVQGRPSREQIVAILQSCRRDIREYCARRGGGPGSRIQCLRDNAANLSPGCQDALAAVASGAPGESGAGAAAPPAIERPARPVSPREALMLVRTSCGADFRAYCRGAGVGGGRAIGCLRENAANLSPGCREALMSLGGRR